MTNSTTSLAQPAFGRTRDIPSPSEVLRPLRPDPKSRAGVGRNDRMPT